MQIVKSRTGRKYKKSNKTELCYHPDTDEKIINIIDSALLSGRNKRLRFFYGDTKTGKSWNEEYDILGYVGRSTGDIKIPLLIKTKNSLSGGAILDDCIIRIQEGKQVLYSHKNFHIGEMCITKSDMFPEYLENVEINGSIYARFKKEGQASNFIKFLKGERNCK